VENERKWEPGWIDQISECGRWTDILPVDTFHIRGDLDCWCKPGIEIIARPDNAEPIIMVKHNLPPHSWVGGALKDEAVDFSCGTMGVLEDLDFETVDPAYIDDDTMICEVCGCIEDDDTRNAGCVGPIYFALDFTEAPDLGESENER